MHESSRTTRTLSPAEMDLLVRFGAHFDLHAADVVEMTAQVLGLPASVPRELFVRHLMRIGHGEGGREGAADLATHLEGAGVVAPIYVSLMGQFLDAVLREILADWPARPDDLAAYQRALARSFMNEMTAGVESFRRAAMERFASGYQATLSAQAGVERMLGLVRNLGAETNARAVFERLVQGARHLARADAAFLWELDRDGRTLRPVAAEGIESYLWEKVRATVGEGIVGRSAATQAVVEGDFGADSLLPRADGRAEGMYRAGLACPLLAKGRLLGVLAVARKAGIVFGEDDKKFLTLLAMHAGSLLEGARAYAEATSAQQGLRHLHSIAHDAVEVVAEPMMLQRIVRGAADLAHSERAVLWSLDESKKQFMPSAWHGVPDAEVRLLAMGAEEGTLAQVVRERMPIEVNLQGDLRVPDPENMHGRSLHSSVRVPVIYRGEVRGVLGVATEKNRPYAAEEIEALGTLASYAASAMETARLYRRALESHAMWQVAFESGEDLLAIVVTPEGAIRQANRALCRRLGVLPESLQGRPFWEALGYAGTDSDPTKQMLSSYASTSYEGEIPRLPGQIFRIQTCPVQMDSGGVLGVILFLREITGRKRLEQQLVHVQKMTEIGGLVSGVAHELNNPLSSVLGFAELAAEAPGVPAEVKQQLEIVRDEAKRAAKIVKNLLAFARQRKPERAMTQLNELAQRVVELMVYELRTSRVHVSLELDPNLPQVLVDGNQIQQVLFNLLQNARHACEEKQSPGTIHVTTRFTTAHVVLSVADTGPGIKPDIVGKLFEPFFTTKPAGKGTGLGLSICYGIVQEHGGQIRFDNRPGEGVTFHVELPLSAPSLPAGECKPLTTQIQAPRGLRILVVDDEPSALEFMKRVLGEANTIVASEDGRRAIQALRNERFDLVITDMRMPGLGGRDLYRFIVREKPELTNYVIFTTGDVLSSDTHEFLKDFSIPTIEKPFSPRDVLKSVIQVMNPKAT